MSPSRPLHFDGATHIIVRGRRLPYFAGCDYLRLSGHPAVRKVMACFASRFAASTRRVIFNV